MSLGTRKTKTEGSGNVLRRRRTILAWGFALPFAVVFCVFMLIPLLSSMAMSFTDITSKDLRTPFNVNFVGLDQYITLFHDHRFLHALGVTGIFVLVGLPITMAIALAFAVALNKGSKHLNAFFRAVFYAPVVASVVAVSVVWRYILQKDGLLNSLLAVFGIAGPDWLHDTRYALPALMAMTIWRNMGTLMIIFLAGLQAIPEELKEAAAIDGCSKWRSIFKITLPCIASTVVVVGVLGLSNVLNAGFDQVYNLYNPMVYATGDILDTWVYRMGLVNLQFSLATTAGLLKSVVSFVLIVTSYALAYKLADYRVF